MRCRICGNPLIIDSSVCTNCVRLETAFSALVDHSGLLSIYLTEFVDKTSIIVQKLATIDHPVLTQGLRWEIETYVHGVRLSQRHAENTMNRIPVLIDTLKRNA